MCSSSTLGTLTWMFMKLRVFNKVTGKTSTISWKQHDVYGPVFGSELLTLFLK